jgi:hypothetical protein
MQWVPITRMPAHARPCFAPNQAPACPMPAGTPCGRRNPEQSEFPYILEHVNSYPRNRARFAGFRDFYPFYLSQHRNPVNRALHFSGNLIIIALVIAAIVTRSWWLLIAVPVAGYGLAWTGHFFFEHNRPATFTHPFYSLIGDWVAFAQTLTGSRPG